MADLFKDPSLSLVGHIPDEASPAVAARQVAGSLLAAAARWWGIVSNACDPDVMTVTKEETRLLIRGMERDADALNTTPIRNCDRYTSPADAMRAFLAEHPNAKWADSQDAQKRNAGRMSHFSDFVDWLYAPADEKERYIAEQRKRSAEIATKLERERREFLESQCATCRHMVHVPGGGVDFECPVPVCAKNDPHFIYSRNRAPGNCEHYANSEVLK